MAESKYKKLVEEFVEETKWGFILDEVVKYGSSHGFFEGEEIKNVRESILSLLLGKYVRFKWKDTTSILFQSPYGKNLFLDLGKRRGSRKSLHLRNAHIHENSFVFAKNKIEAYARLFIEFEEDRDELLETKILSQYSGYAILKKLYGNKKPVEVAGLMQQLGYSDKSLWEQNQSDFRKRNLAKLMVNGLVLEKGSTYTLSPEIAQAFYYAEKIKNDVLRWPYRDNWILPLRK